MFVVITEFSYIGVICICIWKSIRLCCNYCSCADRLNNSVSCIIIVHGTWWISRFVND